ncbi:MAG: mismatch-specific DNA-glycosylase [Hyphomicrobiaceae bacterium]
MIFVGTAAGRRSAELGHYYAGRGNRFLSTLYDVGLTPRCLCPSEFRDLLALGFGLTDISKLGAGMDHQVAKHQFDPGRFDENLRRYRPRSIAFTSKKAASLWLGVSSTRGISYGLQAKSSEDSPAIFVLPSPSGAARSHFSLDPWHKLAHWLKSTA